MTRIGAIVSCSLMLLVAARIASGAGLVIQSSSYSEGSQIPSRFGEPTCGGGGVSPQVGWSGVPKDARSMVVLMIDADGQGGLTVPHWLVFNLPVARHELREGEAQTPGPGYSLGTNVSGAKAYRGPCPPIGDTPHHYYISVIATDLKAGALRDGLNREQLMAALKGHTLVAQSYFGLYGR
jgi:Raf kinase inhibitor-like YbhB/YbcL family protein